MFTLAAQIVWFRTPLQSLMQVVAIAVCTTSVFAQSGTNNKKVLLLFTHDSHQPAQVIIERALRSALQDGSPAPLEFYSEYLNATRSRIDDYEKDLTALLRVKYEAKKLDLIFAINPPALNILLKNRSDLFPDTPIVFLVLDQRNLAGLTLGPNVTGVWGETNYKANLDLALTLHPGSKEVVVISGVSEWDNYWRAQAKEEFRAYEDRVKFTYLIGLPIPEQQKALAGLSPQAIVFFVSSTQDNAGNSRGNIEVLRQICPASSAPVYGFTDAQLGFGIVGGSLVSFEAWGTAGARLGLRVLAGEKPEQIPPHGVPSVSMFDWRELRRWDISETSLPLGSIVRFKDPSLWDQYKYYILSAVGLIILQTALVFWLVAERRRRQIATESRRHLAAIVESSDDAIFSMSLEGRIFNWNSGAELMFGYPADEIISEHVAKLAPENRKEEGLAIIDRITSGKISDHFETVRVTRDGRQIDVSMTVSPLKDERGRIVGASSIARDITERKQAEEALRQSETRFRNMADNAPVMIWITDANKLATYVNKQFLDFTGHTIEEELADGWAGVHPDDHGRCTETYTTSFEGRKPFEIEYRLRRADGEYRWVLANGTPRFSSDGELLGYIGSCIDITERKESEVALTKAHEELSQLKNQLEAENVYLQAELNLSHAFGEIVGQSDAIKHVHFKINQVAATDSTVLIMGETGTGKELVARAIHAGSQRKDKPLIKVNCAALSANLIESELFGHEKGAFTGAGARKLGRFELANNGTIFLDEIGELPLELQVKLLRVIQEGELERVGGTKTIKIDVRIIAATNRNLQQEVNNGAFREDLWYRLNVFPITAPPLRHRREDIPLLVEHFVKTSGKKFGKTLTSVSAGTMQNLQNHPWPGNVRELANVIERSVINSQGSVLRIVDRFEQTLDEARASVKSLEALEKEHIIHVLDQTGWRIEGPFGAAHLLGLKPSTLRARMAKFSIQRRVVSLA